MSLFLLQGAPQVTDFTWEGDPRQALIVLIGIGVVIALAILIRFITSGMDLSVSTAARGKRPLAPRKFSAFTLHRIASAHGLNREQKKLLEYVFRNDAVSDPERVMDNLPLMDRHFRRAYRSIEKNSETDEDAQDRLAKLFSLRNIIEVTAGSIDASRPRLSESTPAVLAMEKDSYPVKVLISRGQSVVVDVPKNSLGSPIRIKKGTAATLSFFTKSSNGFSLSGQVIGSIETDHGTGLQINHTGKLKPLVKRMYRRKQVSIQSEFSIVHISDLGSKKQPKKMFVDPRKFTGMILDISAGGCALKASAQIPAGTRLKITIDHDDSHFIHVLGQVIRTNRSGGMGTILHIKFLKVPRRAFNSISALVYGYADV